MKSFERLPKYDAPNNTSKSSFWIKSKNRMIKSFFNCDPLYRVSSEEFLYQILDLGRYGMRFCIQESVFTSQYALKHCKSIVMKKWSFSINHGIQKDSSCPNISLLIVAS
uniref:Uncharacterized protein n=1 Tax=Lepeophtheirus salmonis TaxID=72036 RepID=A0A0K2UVF6_LEPSM